MLSIAVSPTAVSRHPSPVSLHPSTANPSKVGIHAPRRDPPPAAGAAHAVDWAPSTTDRGARRSPVGWLDRNAAFLTQQLVAAEPEEAARTIAPPAHRVYDLQLAGRVGFAGPLAPVDLSV